MKVNVSVSESECERDVCLPRNLHSEVDKVMRLPRNLHFEVHKVT